MVSFSFLRKISTAIILSTFLLSCRSSVNREDQSTKATAVSQKQTSVKQNIVYGDLVIKEQSDYIMIPVSLSGTGNQRLLRGSSSYERTNLYSNIIFYCKKDGETHLLLNKKAVIFYFDFLEKKGQGKPPTNFLLYRIVDKDTNGDKKLTPEDASIGYLSDLSGKNLRQITPNNTQLVNWTVVQSIGTLFAKIIRDSDNDKRFTERDETTLLKVSLDNPTIGTEMISDRIKQQIKSLRP